MLADAARRDADLRLYTTTDRYEEPIYLQQSYAEERDNCAGLISHHHGYVHRDNRIEQSNISVFRCDTPSPSNRLSSCGAISRLMRAVFLQYGIYKWFVCDHW